MKKLLFILMLAGCARNARIAIPPNKVFYTPSEWICLPGEK